MGVDGVGTPVSAITDPQCQHLLLSGGQRFFGRHFTLQDSLQQQTAVWLIGIEWAAGITAFAKSGRSCQIQAPFGVISAVAAEAVGCEQWCDLRIKIDRGRSCGILSRGGRERRAEQQCEQQKQPSGCRNARDCRARHGGLSGQNRGGWSVWRRCGTAYHFPCCGKHRTSLNDRESRAVQRGMP
jgi:hypothetical protein